MKKVTILLSCFRADDFVDGYIDFLLSGAIKSIAELVVIDFPFSHKDPGRVEKVLKRYPNLVFVRKNKNISLYDTWNQAIGLSKTEFVCNLNLDDRVSADYYSQAVQHLEANNGDVFSSQSVMTSSVGVKSQDAITQEHIPSSSFKDGSIIQYGIEEMVFVSGSRIQKRNVPHCAPVWRRSLHQELGWFNSTQYDFCADFEFWLRVAAAGKKMILHKDPMTIFYCAQGTASDRLMHPESERLLDYWENAWPPENYRPTHLGERHDRLHYCFNLNVIFSSPLFYAHLGNLDSIDKRLAGLAIDSIRPFPSRSKANTPIISVITPMFNAAGYIQSAVDSVFDQGIDDIELLLIDDASTDGSLALAMILASRDGRIRVFENARSKGVSGARNTGLEYANGKFIAFLDVDDEYEPGALKARLAYFAANPEAKMVHSATRMVDEQGADLGVTIVMSNAVTFADAYTNPSHLNAVMAEKSTFRGFSFREGMTNGEDWLFLAEVLRSGITSHYVKNAGATYRIHTSSTVLSDMERHEKLVLNVIDWVYSDATGQNVASKFKQGLSMPPVNDIRAKRDLSLFAWCLLNGNVRTCQKLLGQDKFIGFINGLKSNELIAAYRTPFVRRFLMPIDAGKTRLSLENKNNIAKTCSMLNLSERAPLMWQALSQTFTLDAISIEMSTDQHAKNEAKSAGYDCASTDSRFQKKIALIMGNGPSAKLINFQLLDSGHVASVGMNAAYRFWDGIDFRPDYYICMDTVVIRSHAKRIAELIEEGRVRKFFLRDEFKDIYPNLANNPRVFWFSQARDMGGLFSTNFITTGSWAIRWMLHEGKAIVGTIGIDANYVELLPEARRLGEGNDLRLEISHTPKFNPNYFFNDYQQAGDLYNVPNDPVYLQKKGGLVHVDALRKVAEDMDKARIPCQVFDCSPISDHRTFMKCSLGYFLDRPRMALVTSFRAMGDAKFIRNCMTILEENCANPFIRAVHVLLEGTQVELRQSLTEAQQGTLQALVCNGKLVFTHINSRPSYQSIMEYANKTGAGTVAIVNSDILITRETAQSILLSQNSGNHGVYALTRWNRTDNGDFIQGMQANPPWLEMAPDKFSFNEKNSFSFDSYVYEAPIEVPKALDAVMIGTYGCDTAIAAIFKLAGFSVTNPCLDIKTVHIDDKERSYDGDVGRSDLVNNVGAVEQQLVVRYANVNNLERSTLNLNLLDRSTAWVGGPKTMDIKQSIFRAVGATAWAALGDSSPVSFLKISATNGDIEAVAEEILKLPSKLNQGRVFIEWELSGFPQPVHISNLLVGSVSLKQVGELLYHYQWQAMIHSDHANDDMAGVFADLLLMMKDVLANPVRIDQPAVAAPASESAKATLDFSIIVGDQFGSLGGNLWLYEAQIEKKGKYWQAIANRTVRAGEGYVGCLEIKSDVDIKVRISIGRNGDTPYEGSVVPVSLSAGKKNEVLCKHIFKHSHSGLKIQLEVFEPQQGQVKIEVVVIFFSQCMESDRMNKKLVGVVGPFSRTDVAHYDETDAIAAMFSSALHGKTMIDVGAHIGGALAPFLDRDWRIFAFEPDNQNRAKLLERLAKHRNKHLVSLDTRCVSNKSQKGMSFFTSEQSTGISGLSAFHETHVEAQKVDITTLTEFFEDKPLPEVDFLKIDTEGHDLFVLQGFPWGRGTPSVIECEFEDTKTVPLGYTFHDLARFLVDKGYTVYVSEWHPIIRYGIRHDWRQLMRYPCELADPKGWGNLLAFRDPIDEQALVAAVKKVLKVGGGETAQKPAAQPKPVAPAQSAVAIPVTEANLGFRFEPGAHFTSIAPNQWRFTDAEAKQKLWVAAMGSPRSTAGRSFVGTLRLVADRAMIVSVSLGRYGNTEYEGSAKSVVLMPGVAQTVKLRQRFKHTHTDLKLQIDVLDLQNGASATLIIDNMGINESLSSICEYLKKEELNFRTANQLLRVGDYPKALGIYLWLNQQNPLQMYITNAIIAAHRSGMVWVKTSEDLAWIVE